MCVCWNRSRGDFSLHLYLSSRLLYFAGDKEALFPAGVRHDGHHLRTKRMGCAHFLNIFVCGNLTTGRAAESCTVAANFIAFFISRAVSLVNLEAQLSIFHQRLCPVGRRLGFTQNIGAAKWDTAVTGGIGAFDRPHPNPCKWYFSAFRLGISIRQ